MLFLHTPWSDCCHIEAVFVCSQTVAALKLRHSAVMVRQAGEDLAPFSSIMGHEVAALEVFLRLLRIVRAFRVSAPRIVFAGCRIQCEGSKPVGTGFHKRCQ